MAVRIIKQPNYKWIDLLNPEKEELQKIAEEYNLNFYNLADSLEPNHLPKFEAQENINFMIVRIIHKEYRSTSTSVEGLSNKIAIFYNDRIIVTIHRIEIGFLSDLMEKMGETGKTSTANSLIIKILWNVLNTYQSPIFHIFDQLNEFENKLFLREIPKNMLQKIYLLKRRANLSKKILLLTEEAINSIKPSRQERPAYHDLKDLYTKLRTFYDQVIEDLNNVLNIYISLSSQKTNEIMKTLTVFSIFFMPLTFIAGIYGMNFRYMPELEQKWGYPVIMIVMTIITAVIYYWLKRRKWL